MKVKGMHVRFAALVVLWNLPMSVQAGVLGDAYRAYEKGQYESAVKNFKSEVERNPQNYEQLYNTGVALFKKGDYAEASQYFDRAKQSPDPLLKSKAAYNKGVAMAKQQRWDVAESEFQEALSYDNDNEMIRDNLAFASEQKRRNKQDKKDKQDQNSSSSQQQQNLAQQKPEQAAQKDVQGEQERSSNSTSASDAHKQEQAGQQQSSQTTAEQQEKSSGQQDSNRTADPSSKQAAERGRGDQGESVKESEKTPVASQGAEKQLGPQSEGLDGQKAQAGGDSRTGRQELSIQELKKQEAEKVLRSVDDRIGRYILTPEQANTEGKSTNGKDW